MPATNITDTDELKDVLFDALCAHFEKQNWVQIQAAETLGVPQTRISEIKLHKHRQVSIDRLISYCNTLGINVTVTLVS